ncbi:MAG TPA: hypothetical protein VGG10_02550 [Rhizomicrobium sp.]|jgi:hypothetical protein
MTARMTLLVVASLLGAILVYQMIAPVAPIVIGPAKAAIRPEAPFALPTYQPPAKQDFAIINMVPAFDPNRQPVAEPLEAVTTTQQPPDVSLLGVIIGPEKSMALLRSENETIPSSVTVGQIVEGWRLIRIEPGFVVFHANASDYTVRIRTATGLPQIKFTAPPAAPNQSLPQTDQAH